MMNNVIIHLKTLAQFCQASRDAANGKNPIGTSVSPLPFFCSPYAIPKLVIAIIIYALNAPSLFAFAHIQSEFGKVMPLGANGNPAPSVIVEIFNIGVLASLKHCSPYPKQSTRLSRSSLTVFEKEPVVSFFNKAAARSSSSKCQTRVSRNQFFSAVANTQTSSRRLSRDAVMRRGVSDDFQLSKLASNERDFCRHNSDCFTVLFSGGQSESLSECPLRFSQIPV